MLKHLGAEHLSEIVNLADKILAKHKPDLLGLDWGQPRDPRREDPDKKALREKIGNLVSRSSASSAGTAPCMFSAIYAASSARIVSVGSSASDRDLRSDFWVHGCIVIALSYVKRWKRVYPC